MPPPALDGSVNRHALDAIRALSADRGEALLQRVINAFVDDTPQHLKSLGDAIASGNTATMRKAAHTLKSSSANVGADTLAQLCKDLEQLGRNDTTSGAPDLLTAMEREFSAVKGTLAAMFVKET